MLTTFIDLTLSSVNDLIKYAEEHNLTNTQEFLDALDNLNKLSVKY